MTLFGRRSKKILSFVRVISAVLALGMLVVVITETAKYLYSAKLPEAVGTKIEPSLDKFAAVLGASRASLGSFGDIFVVDGDKSHDSRDKKESEYNSPVDANGKGLNSRADKNEKTTDKNNKSNKEQADSPNNKTQARVVAKVAVLSDSHSDNTYLAKALEKANILGVDIVVFLGDYTDYGDLSSLGEAKKVMDAGKIPYYSLPGDHDIAQTLNETNFAEVFGKTYGIIVLDNDKDPIKLMYFDNSKNYTKLSDAQLAWFKKEIFDTDFLFLSQPLVTKSMSRVMGIVNGVKDDTVFTENLELLELVRNGQVRVIMAGDLHQFAYFADPQKQGLSHYSVGAVLKSQSLEKLNLQSPRFATLYIKEDLSYEVTDIPID